MVLSNAGSPSFLELGESGACSSSSTCNPGTKGRKQASFFVDSRLGQRNNVRQSSSF